MNFLQVIAGPLFDLIDKVLPDADAKAKAKIELLRMQQAGEFKELDAQVTLAQAQTAINQTEAASTSLFVAGWRPFLGWTCGAIFCANYIVVPLFAWIGAINAWPAPPRLDIGEVLPVLLGMLGLGALRTVEKVQKP